MWGFMLMRGNDAVYNLTGANPGHPFHSVNVPDWALAMDGLEIEAVVKNLKVDDQAKADLVTACHLEFARHKRSRHKPFGDDPCVVKLVITP